MENEVQEQPNPDYPLSSFAPRTDWPMILIHACVLYEIFTLSISSLMKYRYFDRFYAKMYKSKQNK